MKSTSLFPIPIPDVIYENESILFYQIQKPCEDPFFLCSRYQRFLKRISFSVHLTWDKRGFNSLCIFSSIRCYELNA